MKIYLVGGAVRDQLLRRSLEEQSGSALNADEFPELFGKERDWVVVGATPTEMLQQGYRQVGKDFPVFLHPQTKEEYALARRERKVGLGYTGFTFDTSTSVTLEEDLIRRDITINAIAQDKETGELIDPYGGQNDIQQRILRHVSVAFAEDPVRILRIARFAARFASLGFRIAPETMELMRQMVAKGEVDALIPERVWKELERALSEKNPEKFFETLAECGADQKLQMTLSKLDLASLRNAKPSCAKIRFACMLNKLMLSELTELVDRFRVPVEFRELALLVNQHLEPYKNSENLSAEEILNLFQITDAFRREERFYDFLSACELCSDVSQTPFLKRCFSEAKAVDVKEIINAGFHGKDIAVQLANRRVETIRKIL